MRNNAHWHVVERPGWDGVFEVGDLPRPRDGRDWYYVRAAQQDRHTAWSSPIRVEAVRPMGAAGGPES